MIVGKQRMIEPYIELYSGKSFYFLDPQWQDFDIKDIAHSLSLTCRFTGQCKRFYSVAEHSVGVSKLLDGTGYEMDGLLHDGGEAYLPDVASPVKQFLPDYNKIEDTIVNVLFDKYGLEYPFHPLVKKADREMLSTEAHYLLPSKGDTWGFWDNERPAIGEKPKFLSPKKAKQLFLDRYRELMYA
jgi:hypothetical protein